MMKYDSIGEIKKRAVELCVPIKVHFELTYRCNFNCNHCYCKGYETTEKELTTDQVYNILDQLADNGCLFLFFIGGEPFIRPDFIKILEYARKKGFIISIQTNGSLITDDSVRKLAELNIKKIELTLYGDSEEVYEMTTGTRSFKKVMAAIKNLRKYRLLVTLPAMLLKSTYNAMPGIKKLIKDLDLPAGKIGMELIQKYDETEKNLEYKISGKQLMEYIKQQIDSGDVKPRLIPPEEIKDNNLCLAGINRAAVDPYGYIRPCIICPLSLRSKTALMEIPFKKLWKNEESFKIFRKSYWSATEKCLDCSNLKWCDPCPAVSYREKGRLVAEAPSKCKIAGIKDTLYKEFKKFQK